ncbi:hypothetical protein BLA29_006704 [Euroglyphus maynei]|uniref:CRAL-TRIO domain-containing protein n=1 Tax=Euroglyphus maynei TaxID=6958 RepID=A0A1Y3AX30_EURMA|nr:hypothetical protein BLA29_006704 [Euroglyphus maynei]
MATEATRSQLAVIENLDEKIIELRQYIEEKYAKNKELYDESDMERWLPSETRNKIKFCKEDEIFDYIDRENLPMYLGGTCRINYHHVPKSCRTSMELGQERGKTLKEINKIMKQFQPLLDEADEESKILLSDN